ncbi:Y-family DNA polymerase [Nitrosomonas halophila]|uniref:DNA polymerase V n=1 Tax=Nitrosomonas halophila TaxID=44576 RepID=A0A1H3MU83_9PROT|nr:DNA polymerase V [Nitrosomonas halophila]
MFALIDGNNFYCSCERVFQPRLQGKPLICLSNNDGCAIARSEEAKALGVKMGHPWFQVKHLEKSAGLVALSANFALYGDMSSRMMSLASELGDSQEIYSIDECFLGLYRTPDVTQRARNTRAKILQWIGIPTCVGIGQTKTQAKLANYIAKQADRKPGSYPPRLAQVCNLVELTERQRMYLFGATDIGEVWGIGRRISQQLKEANIKTVQDFVQLAPATVRKRFSVVLERTWRELHGQSCIDLEEIPAPKKEIAHTRTFGQPVRELQPLIEAITEFTSRAAEKLRKQQSLASEILVFIHTSKHRPGPQYARSITVPLVRPASDTNSLLSAAFRGLRTIYTPGYDLIKAGVILMNLSSTHVQQTELDFGSSMSDRGRLRKRKIKHAKPLLTQMFDCSWHFHHGNCNCPTLAKCRTPLQIESQNTSRANQPSAVLTATARTHAFPPVEYGPPAAC